MKHAPQTETRMARSPFTIVFAAIGIFIVVVLAAAAIIAALGIFNPAADAAENALAHSIIAYVRERGIDARSKNIEVPPLGNSEMISEGASHYDAMCTGCHLAPGMSDNEMRPGMNPRPPRLANRKEINPAEDFWIIKHGIRMTAMPAWGKTHSDQEIWNMVAFLRRLPKLSPEQYRAIVAVAGQHEMDHMNMGGHD